LFDDSLTGVQLVSWSNESTGWVCGKNITIIDESKGINGPLDIVTAIIIKLITGYVIHVNVW